MRENIKANIIRSQRTCTKAIDNTWQINKTVKFGSSMAVVIFIWTHLSLQKKLRSLRFCWLTITDLQQVFKTYSAYQSDGKGDFEHEFCWSEYLLSKNYSYITLKLLIQLITEYILPEVKRKMKRHKPKCVLRVSLKILRSINTFRNVLFSHCFVSVISFVPAINLLGFTPRIKSQRCLILHHLT